MFQKKNPIEREKAEFIKPFTNYVEPKDKDLEQSQGPTQSEHYDSKVSSLTLATTKHEVKSHIVVLCL